LSIDLQLVSSVHEWEGLGDGHGHLQRRRVSLQLDGRRHGRTTRHDVWLPGPTGALEPVVREGAVVPLRRTG